MFKPLSFEDILQEERARVRESNDCHAPSGSPAGGQFCSTGTGGNATVFPGIKSDEVVKRHDHQNALDWAQSGATTHQRPVWVKQDRLYGVDVWGVWIPPDGAVAPEGVEIVLPRPKGKK